MQASTQAVKKAIDDARAGRATLVQLATAHETASQMNLNGCVGELRQHIITMVSPGKPTSRPRAADFAGDVLTGVIAGFVTHHLLGG